jgi:PhnB protein
MSKVSIYLNFPGNTEEAFNFYKSVFKTNFIGPVMKMSDIPAQPVLQATDMLESMGHKLKIGNNTTICLEPDSREETERLFNALSAGGSDTQPLQDMFWGAYWGVCLDKYGIRWMFNYQNQ